MHHHHQDSSSSQQARASPWLSTSLSLINQGIQYAIESATDIVDIVRHLKQYLVQRIIQIPADELPFYLQFITGLEECIAYRENSFDIMDFSDSVILTLRYILVWMMSKGYPLDVFILSRRKALFSDLFKILKKAIIYAYELKNNSLDMFGSSSPKEINDRFGSTIIVNNPPPDSIKYIYTIYDDVICGIFCNESPKLKEEFSTWLIENPYIWPASKVAIQEFLKISFRRIHKKPKDFTSSPKPDNGYRTLQDVIESLEDTPLLPKCKLEIFIRDFEMHEDATRGKSSHFDYKNEYLSDPRFRDISMEQLCSVFDVAPGTKTSIPGFNPKAEFSVISPKEFISLLDDADGIRDPKAYTQRHISPSLCWRLLLYQPNA